MFLNENSYSIYNILDEAGEPQEPGAEPTEADAGMGGDDSGMGEMPQEPGDGETSDMADQDAGVDPNANDGGMGMDQNGGGMDSGMGGEDQDPEETMRKRRLFRDYKELYYIMEDLNTAQSSIPYESLSQDSKKIFNFLEKKMDENFTKIKIVIQEQFQTLDYRTLQTIFAYLKISTKSYAELIKYFSSTVKE